MTSEKAEKDKLKKPNPKKPISSETHVTNINEATGYGKISTLLLGMKI